MSYITVKDLNITKGREKRTLPHFSALLIELGHLSSSLSLRLGFTASVALIHRSSDSD